jgi:hypothetical protein
MGRKNTNAGARVLDRTVVLTPKQLKREAERAKYLLHEVTEPYATPEVFTHKVSASLSSDVLVQLRAVFHKED